MKAWLSLIKTFTYCTLTPSDLKYLALPPSPKCRARIVQQCVAINVWIPVYPLFWSSTTAQQPTLKFSGIRQQWFYFALRFCGSDIWIRQSTDVLRVSVPQCLRAKLGRPEWVRLIQIAGLVSSGDVTHGSESLNQTYHLHVSCPSQQFKGSWNYWDHSSFCLLGKDWTGTPLKRLWISVMEKQCWLDVRF